MKKVIMIDPPKQEEKKPVEFTHYLSGSCGWRPALNAPEGTENVVYLGKDKDDGDMFAAYNYGGHIGIYKGHLNSGEY